ncbi:MAG TPA: 3-phosphoshikimate 1-carboxyvinyltransferase [Polyangiaceae bacterium]|jgi:3-phosphoshikimate 1-carboxyvinyltransferase|nr:3-phosphoshikimate 1-carboxyvinyltransferase [Polyangiaceae bacterium]
MTRILVRPAAKALTGSVPVPSDKSIGHRAFIFGAFARGKSRVKGFSYGEDNVSTMRGFESMGVQVEDDGHGVVVVHGQGLASLTAPAGPIDCGNSGTTMRLVAGVLAAQPFRSHMIGDASLSKRPMGRIARPLRARGASIEGAIHPVRKEEITAPLVIGPLAPGTRLQGLEYKIPVSSAQVKSALLLSGLFANGPTVVFEPLLSRDHTERMLSALGAPIRAAGTMVSLEPPDDPKILADFDIDLPGDLSAAAFLLVAAQLVPGSLVTTRRTGLNPTRSGIIDVIRLLGGTIAAEPQGDVLGEPIGLTTGKYSELRGGAVGGELATRSIDEIPIAAALAARARGTTEFSDVGELRVKESDRIARIVALLRDFGLNVDESPEGFRVEGKPDGALRAARVESHGDHRIAMTACILGLVADGETVVEDADCIATSFPKFVGTLRALGADLEVAT